MLYLICQLAFKKPQNDATVLNKHKLADVLIKQRPNRKKLHLKKDASSVLQVAEECFTAVGRSDLWSNHRQAVLLSQWRTFTVGQLL